MTNWNATSIALLVAAVISAPIVLVYNRIRYRNNDDRMGRHRKYRHRQNQHLHPRFHANEMASPSGTTTPIPIPPPQTLRRTTGWYGTPRTHSMATRSIHRRNGAATALNLGHPEVAPPPPYFMDPLDDPLHPRPAHPLPTRPDRVHHLSPPGPAHMEMGPPNINRPNYPHSHQVYEGIREPRPVRPNENILANLNNPSWLPPTSPCRGAESTRTKHKRPSR